MSDIHELSCIVLCGGQGTRLREVVVDRPKALAEVNSIPFIFLLLDQLSTLGITAVILCTGYRGEQIEQTVGGQYKNITIEYSREETRLGTGGAIKTALGKTSGTVILVLNGDSYVDFDLDNFVQQHSQSKSCFSMVLANVSNAQRFGVVEVDERGGIIGFFEKCHDTNTARPGLINAGVYLINRDSIKAFSSKAPLSLEKEVIPSFVGAGLRGFRTDGRFIDIGTPESFAGAARFFEATLG